MSKNKRYAILIILITNAILISFLESFIPIPIPVPGVKLGLGNIVTMIGIVFLGLKDVLFIVVLRSLVVAVLTRGVMMLPFSLSGGVLSALVMWFLYKKLSDYFSVKGISILGAIVHSAAQLVVASFFLGQSVVMYYLPVLMVASVITGLITGSIAELTINEIREKSLFKDGNYFISNDLVETDITVKKEIDTASNNTLKIDGFIKLMLGVLLVILVLIATRGMSLILIAGFLASVTLIAKIKPKTLLLGISSYMFVVIIPYLFGLWINHLFNPTVTTAVYDVIIKLYRLFVIWYVSILYFHTTPIKTVIGLLEKLFFPLKLIGVPVEDFLKVMMCIVIELGEIGAEANKKLGENMRSVAGNSVKKLNIKGISQVIVSLITNSFKRLDHIQSFVEKAHTSDLYGYSFKVSKKDGIAIMSFLLLAIFVWVLESGLLL